MESMMATGLVVLAAFTAAVLMVMIVVGAIATTRRIARKNRPAEDEIRQRVERRYQQRMVFAFHAVMFVFGNAAYWLSSPQDQWHVLVTTLWAALLCIHGVGLYFSEAKERAVQREIERQWTMNSAEKPKRDRLALSDDGELVEMAWDAEKPQRQSGSYDD